ncbi:hypothetical protein MP228_010728 [Amoeboaphelidium protococcarum]|nr:hypothetical protein MP228_010728 [Amoeboaphelidium protococcarum]
MTTHILFELASGYALFEKIGGDEIGASTESVQQAYADYSLFCKVVKLKSFLPYKNAADALQNLNDVSEGICNASLKSFLDLNFSKGSKSVLGVGDKNLAGAIRAETGIQCESNDVVHEFVRGIRLHIQKMIKALDNGVMEKAQLGLGHSYSRAKVKFNVNRADNMITQAICMLDQLDKDINTFTMRIREWYSWHFPELIKIVADNLTYVRLTMAIQNKSTLSEEDVSKLAEIIGGDDADALAERILMAARSSMGTDISELDILNIESFAKRVESLYKYRVELQEYLHSKMGHVAPNLAALIGDVVGARLISHAGSLTNLSKYPASTVQILGAEKALFRALKTRGNTPKYGLIYHSSFIGRTGNKNKGRISRYLANKCSIASRIDCFNDHPTSVFGEAMKQQVEDRLKYYETGEPVKKNLDVMQSVLDSLADFGDDNESDVEAKVDDTTVMAGSVEVPALVSEEESLKKSKKDKKKSKKRKHDDDHEQQQQAVVASKEEKSKKSKKSKKHKHEKVEVVA